MIAIILLAAGNSRRFQKNKLLYQINEKPMFLYTYEKAKLLAEKYKHMVSGFFVVTRYKEICSLIGKSTEFIYNNNPELGISHSIHLGMKAAGVEDDYLFLVCDMPNLSFSSLERLMEAYLKNSNQLSCLGSKDHYGNPAIFPNAYQEELFSLSGDTGGKQILKKADFLLVEVSEEELEDIDYQTDLEDF